MIAIFVDSVLVLCRDTRGYPTAHAVLDMPRCLDESVRLVIWARTASGSLGDVIDLYEQGDEVDVTIQLDMVGTNKIGTTGTVCTAARGGPDHDDVLEILLPQD